jgi:hypothetical protein
VPIAVATWKTLVLITTIAMPHSGAKTALGSLLVYMDDENIGLRYLVYGYRICIAMESNFAWNIKFHSS